MREKIQSLKFKVQCRGILAFCLLAFGFSLSSSAQPKNISSSEILHRIEGLKTVATVLYIAAHPDDENTRLISYLEKDKHYRVAYLSLTRGEGGQNLIGDEQGMDLGILRTQELLAARKIDGGEQFFSTAYDFGYSKTADETLKKWNRDKIREDILTVMNHLQPDIVICRFPTTGEGGHGHHTASAILAEEAFDTLVKQNGSYVPKKLYWNTFNFGNRNTTSEDQLKIDVGGYNSLLGKSYGEIAAEARSMHRCQAFGSERRRGEQFEYFKTLRDNTPKLGRIGEKGGALMEGIVTDWSRFKGGDAINKKIDAIIKEFDVKDPSKSVKLLLELRKTIELFQVHNNLLGYRNVAEKLNEIDELILDCSGIYIELNSINPIHYTNDSLKLKLNVINRSNIKVELSDIFGFGIGNFVFNNGQSLGLNCNQLISKIIPHFFGADRIESLPFYPYPVYEAFVRTDTTIFGWSVRVDGSFYFPEDRFHSFVFIKFIIDGETVEITRDINYKQIDPSFGEKFQPVFFTPDTSGKFGVLKEIKYDHIPTQIYYTKPDPVLKFDYLKTVNKKIAYISGAGDKIPDILSQMGYDVTLLTESNITTFQLANFSTILTGVRAFNTEKWLTEYKDQLLKYVEEGGNLVIQYNTSNGLVAEIPQPYPFKLSRDRITEEESEVTILDTTVSILNFPNKIRKNDFKNWVQEFGLYFPTEIDSRYKRLFSMHDTGESPNENSTIYCEYGKGKYVYTGLSFFRELPAGVEGATKLFVNLMENNKETKKEEVKKEESKKEKRKNK